MSWASIAKRNTVASSASSASASASSASAQVPTSVKKQPQPPQQPPQQPTLYDISVERIAKEDEINMKPLCWILQRPNSKTCSPFITDEARWAWDQNEYAENQKYSKEVYKTRLAAWRKPLQNSKKRLDSLNLAEEMEKIEPIMIRQFATQSQIVTIATFIAKRIQTTI